MVPPGSRPLSPPPVKRTDPTIRRAFLRFVAAVRSQQPPERVFRRRPGCPPLASRTIRLSAFERQATKTRFGFCNLVTTRGHDRLSSRPSPAPVLSPGSRFDGLTRLESHADLRRRPERALRHAASLTRCSRFRTALALAFATSRAAPAKVRRYGLPRWCCVRRRSPPLLHDEPSCDDPPRHHGERRGPRPARSCFGQREGPVRAHSSREWNAAESPPRERPRTPFVVSPGA